jgi:fermentation-respiration switch protein FrsA (DUF1100 family)
MIPSSFERAQIYYPDPLPRDLPPPESASGSIQDVWLRTSDKVMICAWHLRTRKPRIGTMLFFHGNAGNILDRVPHAEGFAQHGLDVLLVEYRGYGKSRGLPSEPGLYRDGDAAYEYLTATQNIEPSKLLCFGESLGAAVALDLATRRAVAGVVVESGFTSIRELARTIYPFLPGFVFGLMSHRYDNLEKISRLRAPVLFVHGEHDEIVPLAMAQRLFEAAPGPREQYVIAGSGHNDLVAFGGTGYFERIAAFARGTLTGERAAGTRANASAPR